MPPGWLQFRALAGVHFAHAVTGQDDNRKYAQDGPERYLQAVQAPDNQRESPMPLLRKEKTRQHVEAKTARESIHLSGLIVLSLPI